MRVSTIEISANIYKNVLIPSEMIKGRKMTISWRLFCILQWGRHTDLPWKSKMELTIFFNSLLMISYNWYRLRNGTAWVLFVMLGPKRTYHLSRLLWINLSMYMLYISIMVKVSIWQTTHHQTCFILSQMMRQFLSLSIQVSMPRVVNLIVFLCG